MQMKFSRIATPVLLTVTLALGACKQGDKPEDALAQDTSLAHDLQLANADTMAQPQLKDVPTLELVERGRPVSQIARDAGITFLVNDDVEAALALDADGVHLGRSDKGKELARAAGLTLGLSATIPVILAAWAPAGVAMLMGVAFLLHLEDG